MNGRLKCIRLGGKTMPHELGLPITAFESAKLQLMKTKAIHMTGCWHNISVFHFYSSLQIRVTLLMMFNTLMVLQMRLILSISIAKEEHST